MKLLKQYLIAVPALVLFVPFVLLFKLLRKTFDEPLTWFFLGIEVREVTDGQEAKETKTP